MLSRRQLVQVAAVSGVAAVFGGCGPDYARENSQQLFKYDLEAYHVLGSTGVKNEESGFSLRHPIRKEGSALVPRLGGREFFLSEGAPVEIRTAEGDLESTEFYPYFYSWTDGTRGLRFEYPRSLGNFGQQDTHPNSILLARSRDALVDPGIVIFSKGETRHPFQIERVLNTQSNQEKIRFVEVSNGIISA
jgi:hypothetical protein